MHKYAFMRTTIDIPENLYRTLKTRAALKGLTLREIVQNLIEQALSAPLPSKRRSGPPIAVKPTGVPIPALSRQEIREIEEIEDAGKYA